MIAKLASITRRLTNRIKVGALLVGSAAGIVSGYAFAISPTIDTARTYAGGASFNFTSNGEIEHVYVVPPGKVFTLTDIVASNFSTTGYYEIHVSSSAACSNPAMRLNAVIIPGTSTVHLPLVSGVSVASGKAICLLSTQNFQMSMRGFLSDA